MASNVNVTYQDMRDAATKLRTGQHDIQQKLSDMQKYVNQLVNAGYVTDRSSKQFDQSYTEFNTGANKTVEGIDGMAKFLEQAAQTFQQADEQLAKGIGH
jgi:WXG100 family type VII secretion target